MPTLYKRYLVEQPDRGDPAIDLRGFIWAVIVKLCLRVLIECGDSHVESGAFHTGVPDVAHISEIYILNDKRGYKPNPREGDSINADLQLSTGHYRRHCGWRSSGCFQSC